jgi:hypothetical protein
MHGVLKTVDRPLEYAFAIRFAIRLPGPYTPADIESQLSRVQQEWKNAAPWERAKPKYEKRAAELIQETMDQTPDKPVVSLEQPQLFSVERIAPEAFVVVSIRQRRIGVASDTFVSTAVDGSAFMVLGGRLIRLSLVKELQVPSDADSIKQAVARWIHRIQLEQTNN